MGLFFTALYFRNCTIRGLMNTNISLSATSRNSQLMLVRVSGLQFTLAPIDNILFIKPYRSALRCGSHKPAVQVPAFTFTFSTASNNYTRNQ
ncbi:hypothetical protein PRIPAC_82602 [Pristionchus pacificus]|uniref:Uncharacterized protein n=1 Tax=Pristionchus pacificus TaxID=54126 RepID=A0A2A6CPS3_PRIPA|nr:hypothetical protein PRIPAC_82602 [Pristionchus pacificus]|eukprot:PDM80139.1 hypothetical protein PRIPAC_32718 [Pristionchus pacificus]